jgi:hypothetical protein
MASGILGKSNLSASTNTAIYTVPSGKVSSFTVTMVNRNATQDAQIQLAISDTSTPAVTDYIEFNTAIPAYGTFERTGLVANAAAVVVALSSVGNVTVMTYGFEE